MTAIRKAMRMLRADQRGATAIEYGLICALIVLAMIAGATSLAGGSSSMWGRIQSNMTNVM